MMPRIGHLALAAGLSACIVATSVALVMTTHRSRQLFQELEELKAEEDRLQGIWTALELEVGTLADYSRVSAFARDELGMTEPGEHIEYVVLSQ